MKGFYRISGLMTSRRTFLHRLPKTAMSDAVTMGGVDEAYYYWERSGQFWEADTGSA